MAEIWTERREALEKLRDSEDLTGARRAPLDDLIIATAEIEAGLNPNFIKLRNKLSRVLDAGFNEPPIPEMLHEVGANSLHLYRGK